MFELLTVYLILVIDIVDSSDDDEVVPSQSYFTLKHDNKEPSTSSTRPARYPAEQIPEPSNFEGNPISKHAQTKWLRFWFFLVVDNFALSLSDVDGSDHDDEDNPSMSTLSKEKNVEKVTLL